VRPQSCGLLALALLMASPVAAQRDRSGWGVSASFAPVWRVPPEAEILFEVEPVDIQGSEFRIGIVRGRDLGGDWGVSFVRKRIKDGSTIGAASEQCFGPIGCGLAGHQYVYEDVRLTGVEIHKFVTFVTIKQRVQVGMNFAGGVARFKGRTVEYLYDPFVRSAEGFILSATTQQPTVVMDGPQPRDLFIIKPVPLAKVEIGVAGILAPGLKVRVSGGLNIPGYHVGSVTVQYLFGTR